LRVWPAGCSIRAPIRALVGTCTLDQKALADARNSRDKCPRSVKVRNEMLPLSGAGKILKRELRKPHWEGKARQ
jgi:acyl-CoA synthetase (AMP-forming)/AMP-acid ligase II